MKRSIAVMSFLLWTGIILSTYYVVQKPGLLNAFTGLADTFWTLIVATLLLFDAYGIGIRIISWLSASTIKGIERLLLGTGIGLGGLGLLGLAISAAQIAATPVFFFLLIVFFVFFIFLGDLRRLRSDLSTLSHRWNLSFSQYNFFTKLVLVLLLIFSFLLTLAPPFEAFDALSYHLAQPARILQDGGLRAVDIPPFWYPNITENVYLWALALHGERAAQIIHFAWAVMGILLLWHWAVRNWGVEIGRKTLLLIASLSSLPLISSWVYADMALVFYTVAALFALSSYERTQSRSWLYLTGVAAGLAMSVKYTSFVLPLTCGLLLLTGSLSREKIKDAALFSGIALLIALPWYIRNAWIMHNPFYPFFFDGLYWNPFRKEWYADAGTGIGWDVFQILLIPFNMILGHRELAPADGRIGPLFLMLLPFTLWVFTSSPRPDSSAARSLRNIGVFTALSFIAWTLGVINSTMLWQVRLFYPALIPFAIPTALGWDSLTGIDSSRFRVSFLANVMIGAVVTLTILDHGIFVLQRNPLSVAFGTQSRARYIERVNPSYAALIQIMYELPQDAHVYSLFEPRSYDFPRPTQPDIVNYNFLDSLYLHLTPPGVIEHWRAEGYTHVLVYERGMDLIMSDPSKKISAAERQALRETLHLLVLVRQTPDQIYSIYKIP